jgi:transposase
VHRENIPKAKLNIIRKRFILGTLHRANTAIELKISRTTVLKYCARYKLIKAECPEKLKDMNFYLPNKPKIHRATDLYIELMAILPQLVTEATGRNLKAMPVWHSYKQIYPYGYTYSPFKIIFRDWLIKNISMRTVPWINPLSVHDIDLLNKWRISPNHREWQLVMFVETALKGETLKTIREKADTDACTVRRWIKQYNKEGAKGLVNAPRIQNSGITDRLQTRKNNVIKLLHESPKLHRINRTSWSIQALTAVYAKLYDDPASYMQISRTIQHAGFGFKKSRDMLVSPDPDFRAKIQNIQNILQQLKPGEKFFSIDEYGPVSVRLKGGRTLQHQSENLKRVPLQQKSKGFIICTAALELSTNQITHFFSWKKDTTEMIKLLDVLAVQYKGNDRLYISWDAASWHSSNVLIKHIFDCNNPSFREKQQAPEIILVPLPSCTQYLNVIESVFSGLARAVIHNSDYQSMEECRYAIGLHFETRNRYFQDNPKRAGQKIWGNEIVVPQFSETHHARKPSGMRGAR